MCLHRPPTPIPSPQMGWGGAACLTVQPAPSRQTLHLPHPFVGEGWGGGAIRRQTFDRRPT
jgi:hypothetical protein